QAVDDHAAKLLALNINTLPEAGRSEEYSVRRLAKLLQQHMPWCSSVQQQRIGQLRQHALVDRSHLAVAREQAEGAALRDLEHPADAFGRAVGEVRLARIRHRGRQVKQGLTLVLEVRGHNQFACGNETETLADVIETSGDSQRRRG